MRRFESVPEAQKRATSGVERGPKKGPGFTRICVHILALGDRFELSDYIRPVYTLRHGTPAEQQLDHLLVAAA